MTNVTMQFLKTLRAVAVSLAAVAMTLFLTAGPAAAHAQLTGSNPGDGDTLAEPPQQLVLEFSERLDVPSTQVALVSPTGDLVSLPLPEIKDKTITQSGVVLPMPGEYTFSYRIVSSDGHPVEGSVVFTVESVPRTNTSANAAPSNETSQAAFSGSEGGTSWAVVGLVTAGAVIVVAGALLAWRKLR